jgi:hypothetical protein
MAVTVTPTSAAAFGASAIAPANEVHVRGSHRGERLPISVAAADLASDRWHYRAGALAAGTAGDHHPRDA